MNICIFGAGYVGLSLAVMLSTKFIVTLIDIDKDKIKKINESISPISDSLIAQYLPKVKNKLFATSEYAPEKISSSDMVFIATPTDYDPEYNFFNVSSVDKVIDYVYSINPTVNIVVKSTLPVGYIEKTRLRLKTKNL